MKRILFSLLILTMFCGTVHAQRLLPLQDGLEVYGGVPIQKRGVFKDGSFMIGFNYMRHVKHYHYYYLGVEYLKQNYHYDVFKVPTKDYLADGGFMFHVISTPGKNFLLYAGGYATLGYEDVNNGEEWMPDGARLNDNGGFVFGGGVQFSFEGFITDNVVLFTRAKGHFMGGTDIDLFRPSLNFGIRVTM